MAKPTGITKLSAPKRDFWSQVFSKKGKLKTDKVVYSTTKEYRGLNVSFSVEKIDDNNYNYVKVSVHCHEINRGNYTNTTVDTTSIDGAFDSLFNGVKKYIDNYLDYDKNIRSAISNLNADRPK